MRRGFVALIVWVGLFVPAPTNPSPASALFTLIEYRFVELANQERAKRNLSQLQIDPLLISIARLHSAEMRDKKYFNHVSPTPGLRTPMERYLRAVPSYSGYTCVGENLFWSTGIDVERGHQAFMESPTHRENVLFARFEKIGVGIAINETGELWVTQMFLTTTDPSPAIAKRGRS